MNTRQQAAWQQRTPDVSSEDMPDQDYPLANVSNETRPVSLPFSAKLLFGGILVLWGFMFGRALGVW